MEIRKILETDLSAVVTVHKNSFKDFFLTKLGDGFLFVYYDSIRKNDNALLFGVFDNKELCGFCAATTFSRGFNKKLIKNNLLSFFLVGIRILFINPISLFRLYKNLSKNNPNVVDDGEYAELLSIGVSVNRQGEGFGKKLLFELEHELKLKGCNKVALTTDYNNNNKTLDFYNGMGYSVFYEFLAFPNRKMYKLIKYID